MRGASFIVAAAMSVVCAHAAGQETLRVATWNVQTIGNVGTGEHDAAVAVANRIGADVLMLNEIASTGDVAALMSFASATGYAHVLVPGSNPFGELRNAVLSKHPFSAASILTSPVLSGDPPADDMTRLPLLVEFSFPGGADVRAIVQHWKSGTANSDEFRRAIESVRVEQAAMLGAIDLLIVAGDVNEEITATPSPPVFTALPSGLPASFVLGMDLMQALASGGIESKPFGPIVDGLGLLAVPAKQLDGSETTRPSSGRRLDYVFIGQGYWSWNAEVYDSDDEALGGGLAKFGSALAPGTSAAASDHLPVFVDLSLPETCAADCDRSGTLDLFDFFCFVNHFNDGQSYACNCDTSGGAWACDLFDFFCFVNSFNAGCP